MIQLSYRTIKATIVFFAALSSASNAADKPASFGSFATPTGGIISLDKFGLDLKGSYVEFPGGTSKKIVGKNSTPGSIELKLLDSFGNESHSKKYSLDKIVVNNENGYEIFAKWSEVLIEASQENSLPNSFHSLIESSNNTISKFQEPDVAISISDLIEVKKSAISYFGNKGINTSDFEKLVFDNISSDGSVEAFIPRRFTTALWAYNYGETKDIRDAISGSNLAIQTLGVSNSIVSIKQPAWSGVWDNSAAQTSVQVSMRNSKVGLQTLRDRNRYLKERNGTIGRVIYSSVGERIRFFEELVKFRNSRHIFCELDRHIVDGRFSFACDHHSDRYGLNGKKTWMKSYITMFQTLNKDGSEKIINIDVESVAANVFLINDLTEIKGEDYTHKPYRYFHDQEKYFMDDVFENITWLESK